jgi:NAD(P)-dependent dehydrogenase (short-subunit alcohol dehydrogenase family)
MLPEFNLQGKTALITGGGRGIGRAIALVFAEAGADVAVTARSAAQVQSVAAEIEVMGRKGVPLVCDVADSAQVDSAVAEATRKLGKIDILVNNAGAATVGPVVPVPDVPDDVDWRWPADQRMSDDTFRQIFATNLDGSFYMARAVAPQMIERRSGKVINIASTSANLAFPYEAAYAPSKAAVQMLTKVLALEWGPYNVTVNAISPGWFKTEMTEPGFKDPAIAEARVKSLPLRRLTDLRELGLLALYLACPAADWMTGQVIVLDGGESAIAYAN